VDTLVLPAAQGVAKLEGPQEVVGSLEVGTASVDLVDEVLNADDVFVAEGLGDDLVVGQGDALLVDLAVTALVDKIGDGLQGGLAVGDVWLNAGEHGHGGEVDLHEGGVVKLTQTEKLEDLLGLGVDTHDTADTDDQENLGHVLDEVVAEVLGLALGTDESALVGAVLLHVLLSTLEDDLAGSLLGLGVLGLELLTLGLDVIKGLPLLEERFGNLKC